MPRQSVLATLLAAVAVDCILLLGLRSNWPIWCESWAAAGTACLPSLVLNSTRNATCLSRTRGSEATVTAGACRSSGHDTGLSLRLDRCRRSSAFAGPCSALDTADVPTQRSLFCRIFTVYVSIMGVSLRCKQWSESYVEWVNFVHAEKCLVCLRTFWIHPKQQERAWIATIDRHLATPSQWR